MIATETGSGVCGGCQGDSAGLYPPPRACSLSWLCVGRPVRGDEAQHGSVPGSEDGMVNNGTTSGCFIQLGSKSSVDFSPPPPLSSYSMTCSVFFP